MKIEELSIPGFERVVEAELVPGIRSIIAIHNTKLGPALGGCRFYSYTSHQEALTDVLRLAEGMSYKSAMANLKLGGGKSVIIGDPRRQKSEKLFEAFGEFVDSLKGDYITAKDVGIEVENLDIVARKTKYVRGTSAKESSGDPSPVTAYGIYLGIKATAQFKWKNPSLKGKRIIVQGLGHVGLGVVKHLVEEGAEIHATEIDENVLDKSVKEFGVKKLGANEWQETRADIFCPCAMGAVINKQSIAQLAENGVQIIAGGANNQLLDVVKDSERVKEAGILYAPDYIINAGGVINVYCELRGLDATQALQMTQKIYDVLLSIFERAEKENKPTSIVSLNMAREILGLK